jgi:chemotaxis receptor (MCP) glutamine deamidase CheD
MGLAFRQFSVLPVSGSAVERRIHIIQGEYHVTGEPGVMLTALLGSCVAVCLPESFDTLCLNVRM